MSPLPKKRMKYAVSLNLLLIENGRLSPGGGTPCPPRLAALVASPRVEISLANIFSLVEVNQAILAWSFY